MQKLEYIIIRVNRLEYFDSNKVEFRSHTHSNLDCEGMKKRMIAKLG